MQTELLSILAEMARSETGMNELFQAKSRKEIIDAFQRNGFELSEQDLDSFIEQFSDENVELDESFLETVSGGNPFGAWPVFGIILPLFEKRNLQIHTRS